MARLNKSQWIRSQSSTLGAKEVVDLAAKQGITLSLQQVYTARSAAKRVKAPVEKAASARVSTRAQDPKQEFCRLAVRLGTDEAQRILSQLQGSTALH